jgi:hypothetical protein
VNKRPILAEYQDAKKWRRDMDLVREELIGKMAEAFYRSRDAKIVAQALNEVFSAYNVFYECGSPIYNLTAQSQDGSLRVDAWYLDMNLDCELYVCGVDGVWRTSNEGIKPIPDVTYHTELLSYHCLGLVYWGNEREVAQMEADAMVDIDD